MIRSLMALILASYARTVGLTREEASQLHGLLSAQELPQTVDQAWTQLDRATIEIRRNRHHPPLQQ